MQDLHNYCFDRAVLRPRLHGVVRLHGRPHQRVPHLGGRIPFEGLNLLSPVWLVLPASVLLHSLIHPEPSWPQHTRLFLFMYVSDPMTI